jgi:succinate-semialdehyde dehydrogenase/glutarate-semialdehyde dehydrogenase
MTRLSFDIASIPTKLFIDGKWLTGSTGKVIGVVDPSSGEVIASVADASIEDGLEAVRVAHEAGPAWAATSPRKRSEVLRRCFDLMNERKDMLAELISLENGKALSDAKGEVAYAAEFFRWFSEEAVRLNGDISIAPGGANRIVVEHHARLRKARERHGRPQSRTGLGPRCAIRWH